MLVAWDVPLLTEVSELLEVVMSSAQLMSLVPEVAKRPVLVPQFPFASLTETRYHGQFGQFRGRSI